MRMWRTLSIPLPLLVASVTSSSCTSMPTSREGRPAVIVPRGWRTYAYGATAIAVPKSWWVVHDAGCPATSSSGTLDLGPAVSVPDDCSSPEGVEVSVLPLPCAYSIPSSRGIEESSCPVVKVNGLQVYVGPCGSSDAADTVWWTVPSLGIQAVGTGINAYAPLNQILHTIHSR
jgi:hypothetical protein